jgi:hypothetical protein
MRAGRRLERPPVSSNPPQEDATTKDIVVELDGGYVRGRRGPGAQLRGRGRQGLADETATRFAFVREASYGRTCLWTSCKSITRGRMSLWWIRNIAFRSADPGSLSPSTSPHLRWWLDSTFRCGLHRHSPSPLRFSHVILSKTQWLADRELHNLDWPASGLPRVIHVDTMPKSFIPNLSCAAARKYGIWIEHRRLRRPHWVGILNA